MTITSTVLAGIPGVPAGGSMSLTVDYDESGGSDLMTIQAVYTYSDLSTIKIKQGGIDLVESGILAEFLVIFMARVNARTTLWR